MGMAGIFGIVRRFARDTGSMMHLHPIGGIPGINGRRWGGFLHLFLARRGRFYGGPCFLLLLYDFFELHTPRRDVAVATPGFAISLKAENAGAPAVSYAAAHRIHAAGFGADTVGRTPQITVWASPEIDRQAVLSQAHNDE
jgi:hypothetical protein